MSYKDLKQPLASDAPAVPKDEPKHDAPANDPGEAKSQTDAQKNEHGSGHGKSDAEKKPM